VVCVPDGRGGWFVDRLDVNGKFPAELYGWTVKSAANIAEASRVC
jgi:hypothetical protein